MFSMLFWCSQNNPAACQPPLSDFIFSVVPPPAVSNPSFSCLQLGPAIVSQYLSAFKGWGSLVRRGREIHSTLLGTASG